MLTSFPSVGCDNSIVIEDPRNASVLAAHVVFDLDEAEYNGPVASAQFRVPEITLCSGRGGGIILASSDANVVWEDLLFVLSSTYEMKAVLIDGYEAYPGEVAVSIYFRLQDDCGEDQ